MKKMQIAMVAMAAAAASAVVSSVVTYSVVYKKFNEEFEERLLAERASMAEWQHMQRQRMAQAKVVYGSSNDDKPSTPEEFVGSRKPPIDYSNYSKKSANLIQPVEQGIDTIPTGEKDRIVEITGDEFMEYSGEGFDEISLSWYGQGQYLDSDGDLVPDYPDMVGLADPPFGGLSGEDHIAYLKNSDRREVYEITREEMTIDEATAADIHVPDGGRST